MSRHTHTHSISIKLKHASSVNGQPSPPPCRTEVEGCRYGYGNVGKKGEFSYSEVSRIGVLEPSRGLRVLGNNIRVRVVRMIWNSTIIHGQLCGDVMYSVIVDIRGSRTGSLRSDLRISLFDVLFVFIFFVVFIAPHS